MNATAGGSAALARRIRLGVAVFYRHDGQAIPDPVIIVLGRIEFGVDNLDFAGPVKATVELDDEP